MTTLNSKGRINILRGIIFFWVCTLFMATVHIKTADAGMTHFSRACGISGVGGRNESGTWNLGADLDGFYYVRSHHLNYNYTRRQWEYQHFIDSGWNGVQKGWRVSGAETWRSVAGHSEFLSTPGVVGHHYWFNPTLKRAEFVQTTKNMICPNF